TPAHHPGSTMLPTTPSSTSTTSTPSATVTLRNHAGGTPSANRQREGVGAPEGPGCPDSPGGSAPWCGSEVLMSSSWHCLAQTSESCQALCSAANDPEPPISSSGEPSSTTSPWLITRTRSAIATVDNRCAMISAVRS